MANEKLVSDEAARSVAGAGTYGALCETAVDSSTGKTFTVTEWAGRYVKITPKGDGVFYVFSETAALASALDKTAEADDSGSPDGTVPDFAADGAPVHEVVPKPAKSGGVMYLHVLADTGTAEVRVRPS